MKKPNETKRNETKRLLLSLINNHFKTFLITLLSLTLLFSISCSNEGTTGGGTGGGTETTEEGNFPPPVGTYRDEAVWNKWKDPNDDTTVSTTADGKTRIKGMSSLKSKGGGGQRFGFDISKWKKTTKGGKITKTEAVAADIVVETGYNFSNISIVYYYDSSTLSITFKNNTNNKDCSFNGTK